jgi:hypothetical protein
MKAAAASGETVTVVSGGQEFTFQAVNLGVAGSAERKGQDR